MPRRKKGLIVGYTPRPHGEIAAEVFAALRALDGHQAERAELTAAGIPASTIDSLYGTSFTAMLSGLLEYFTNTAAMPRYNGSYQSLMNDKIKEFMELRKEEALDVQERWSDALYAMQQTPEHEAFRQQLRGHQNCEPQRVNYFTDIYMELLRNAWWVMANRQLLGEEQREWSDDLISSASWDLFTRLRSDIRSEVLPRPTSEAKVVDSTS
jgi:hypothetical protein